MTFQPPVVRRVRMSRPDREQQLLDVAEELFLRKGFAATSIEDICRTAGVSRPVVYDLLGDKEAILVACSTRARRDFVRQLAEAIELGQPADLPALVEATNTVFFRMLSDQPTRWELFFGSVSPLAGRIAAELGDLRYATVAQIVELVRPFLPGASDAQLDMFAHALAGLGEQLGRWWLRRPDVPIDQVIATHRDFILAMAATVSLNPQPLPGADPGR